MSEDAFRLSEPGIYTGIDAAAYHADPAPEPSLTQSIAKILLERSPRHAQVAHPRLNPDYEPDDDAKYDIGNIAHCLLLGRGKAFDVVDYSDWRTKAAQETRKLAAAAGKIAVLEKDHTRASAMAMAALHQLIERGFEFDWAPGAADAEAVVAWSENDIWLRCMIDWLSADRRKVWDLKTTSASAAPHQIAGKMENDGWTIQAAMHERGLNAVHPESAGRREHLFICQETQPPFALTIVRLPESALQLGRRRLNVAIGLWSDCIRRNEWPAYPSAVVVPHVPEWSESRWLNREIEEFAHLIGRPA